MTGTTKVYRRVIDGPVNALLLGAAIDEDTDVKQSVTILLLLKRVDCNDGVASYLESVVTGLRDAGDRVVIVSGEVTTLYGSESRRRAIAAAALDWIVLDNFAPSRPAPRHVRQLLATIDRYDVDVVSPQGFGVLPIGYVAARLRGRAVATNYHPSLHGDSAAAMPSAPSARQKAAYCLVNTVFRADRYIALSTDIVTFFRSACGIPARRIELQVLGVETDFYREPSAAERHAARARFALADETFVAVLPGRMNLNKGHDLAAAAFRLLRERRGDRAGVCLFPGAGDQRAAIEANVLRDDADRATFRFLGYVERETLRDSYWAADVVVLPSRMEGFGLVVAEAMCCGAIAIRTPSGGWQDQIVPGKTGYVVPFNDPAALANAIETVADSSDRASMRRNAIELASTSFAKSRMIERTGALYRELASRKRRRAERPGTVSR